MYVCMYWLLHLKQQKISAPDYPKGQVSPGCQLLIDLCSLGGMGRVPQASQFYRDYIVRKSLCWNRLSVRTGDAIV